MPGPYRLYIGAFLAILLCRADCDARITPMRHYTTENGLPSNLVYDVYRDHLGFLWFSTDKGITRYNGVSFEKFTTADGLPDNEIFFVKEDHEQRLWLGCYNGKLCYYKNGVFYSEKKKAFLRLGFNAFFAPKIHVERDSTVTFLLNNKVVLNIRGERVCSFTLPVLTGESPHHIVKKGPNEYIVQYEDKNVFTDTLGHIIRTVPGIRKYTPITGVARQYLLSDSSVYGTDGSYLFPQAFSYTADRALVGNNYLLKIYEDNGRQFFCTRKGLFTNDQDTLLAGQMVTSICSDINGNYWIATSGEGIYHINKAYYNWMYYKGMYSGRLLKPVLFGNCLYYQEQGKPRIISFDHGAVREQLKVPLSGTLRDKLFAWINFYIFSRDKFIILTSGIGKLTQITLHESGRQYSKYYPGMGGCHEIFSDGKYLYSVTSTGIDRVYIDSIKRPGTGNHTSIASGISESTKFIMSWAQDAGNHLWYCTYDSVYKIEDGIKYVQPQFKKTFRKFIFCGNYLVGFDDNNVLYIYRISGRGALLVKRIESASVMWSKCYAIRDKYVIATTNSYYHIIDLTGGDVSVYPVENPFIPQSAEFIYADDANCYFFRNEDVTSVSLSSLFVKLSPPGILFTGVSTPDKRYGVMPEINISDKESENISIDFAAISFISKDISYQYSISGNPAEDHWTAIKGNSINLSSPGYGAYYIKLRAKGLSTGYSAPISLILKIRQPFWRSWWFIVLTVLAAFVFFFIITRAIVLMILRRRRLLYDLESRYHAAEYKTLNALMNPHFIFNSLNNIKGLMNRDDKKMANKFLSSFSSVVRQNMQNIAKENISLQEELQLVGKYLELEKIRYGAYVNYKIEIEESIDLEEIFIPPLLIQPLVENAIKHGLIPKWSAESMIVVRVYRYNNSVYIEVEDNGVGLDNHKDSEHEGYDSLGLQNIEKRVSYLRLSGRQQIFFSISSLEKYMPGRQGTLAVIEIKS